MPGDRLNPDPPARQVARLTPRYETVGEPGIRPLSSQTRTVARVEPRTTRKGWKMANILTTVGIDVSKDRLDVALLPGREQFSVANDASGWKQLLKRLRRLDVRAVGLEASGGYERGLVEALLAARLSVRLVNSWKLRQFARGIGVLAKNDRLDACVIARFVADVPTREVRP